MENRFENNSPGENNWGDYVSQPDYNLQTGGLNDGSQATLCVRVRVMLPPLLENDGSVRPEMAAAIYGHLTICPDCAQHFDDMQRVVALMEALPPADMPQDFSALIMARIQIQALAIDSAVVGSENQSIPQALDALERASTVRTGKSTTRTASTVGTYSTQENAAIVQERTHFWERLTAGGILSGILAYFLSTTWGRQMLGANVATASVWLEQMNVLLQKVPVLAWIIGLVVSTLSQANGMLSETYQSLGAMAVRGLVFDIAICAIAYYYMMTKQQRERTRGY